MNLSRRASPSSGPDVGHPAAAHGFQCVEFAHLFEELSALTPAGSLPSMEQLVSLDAKYGLTTMGPPMTTPMP